MGPAVIPAVAKAAPALIQWAPIALNAVGSALSALGGASEAKKDRKEQKAARHAAERQGWAGMEQNERQYGYNANMQRGTVLDNRALTATDLEGRLNRAPMADQAQYLIQQRLGMGNVVNGQNAAAAAYRPGMGGVDTTQMRATFDRLRDESRMPGEYEAQTGGQMRMTALRDQYMQEFARAKKPQDRQTWERRIRELDRIIGAEASGGSGVDNYDPYANYEGPSPMDIIRQRAGGGALGYQRTRPATLGGTVGNTFFGNR